MKRPLIFLNPLSDSLKKLKEVTEEMCKEIKNQDTIDSLIPVNKKKTKNDLKNNDDNNEDSTEKSDEFDIYEASNLGEMAQLLPTVGPSLTFVSSPKKCAQMLQDNKRTISQLRSKVILLTTKEIAPKIVEKMIKLGLTEYILEPVAPKTLLYKVRLLLKSLPVNEKKKEENESLIITSDSDAETSASTKEKLRVEKGIMVETSAQNDSGSKSEKIDLNIIQAEQDDKNDNAIPQNGVLSEKNQNITDNTLTLNIEPDGTSKKKNYTENEYDYIEKYYKGKNTNNISIDFDNEDQALKKNRDNNDSEESFYNDPEIQKAILDLNIDKSSSHSKPSNQTDSLDEYKIEKLKQSTSISIELEKEKNRNKNLQEQTEDGNRDISKNKKNAEITLELENEKQANILNQEENSLINNLLKEKKEQVELNLEKEKQVKNENEKQVKEKSTNDPKQVNTVVELEIEKHKKNSNNVNLEVVNDIEKELQNELNEINIGIEKDLNNKNTAMLELDKEASTKKKNTENVEQLDDNKDVNLQGKTINIELDLSSHKEKNNSNVIELDFEKKNKFKDTQGKIADTVEDYKNIKHKDVSLQLATDNENEKEHNSFQKDDSGYTIEKVSKHTGLELVKDEKKEDSESGNSKTEKEAPVQIAKKKSIEIVIEDGSGKKISTAQNFNQIDKYYGLKKKNKNIDQNWDAIEKKQNSFEFEFSKAKKSTENVIQIDMKSASNLAIDYTKLRNEFNVVGSLYDLKKKREQNPDDDTLEIPPELLAQLGNKHQQHLVELLESTTLIDEALKEKTNVFVPQSNGIEYLIQVLNLCYNKQSPESIYVAVSKMLFDSFNGNAVFFSKNFSTLEYSEICNNMLLQSNISNKDQIYANWIKNKNENFDRWNEIKTPTWQDSKFSIDHNEFIFPYYDGLEKIGFAILALEKKINEEQSKTVETLMESVRCLYLQAFNKEYLKNQNTTDGSQEKSTIKEKKKNGGFFSNIFKKAS